MLTEPRSVRSSCAYSRAVIIGRESFQRFFFLLLAVCLIGSATLWAQIGTGTVSGTITDESGAVIPNASIVIANKATGAVRNVNANGEGLYSAPALPAGNYQVRATVQGFVAVERDAQVLAGSETTVNIALKLGESKEVVTVEAATAQINYDSHAVAGSIERQTVQELPLNGRNFLQLATVEPGVTVSAGATSARNTPIGITMLGGATGTQGIFTLDGLSITDIYDGTGVVLNFSQEMVQEFQITTVNYDLSNGLTAVGAVNIVSRGGGNDFHGSAYYFYRDHNMAAYPSLKRSAFNPNPYFQRKNPGFWFSGPIIKDKFFFFFNFEDQNQVQALSAQQDLSSLQPIGAIFSSPQTFHSLNTRLDYRLSDRTTIFARYTHDGNVSFGANGGVSPEPSNWLNNDNWSDQYAAGVTTAVTPTLVNDFRAGLRSWRNKNYVATQSECQAPCVGAGLPQVSILGSSTFVAGNNSLGTNERALRGLDVVDTIDWQKGSHRMKFGAENDYQWYIFDWAFCAPACLSVVSPETAAATPGFPAASLANLPKNIATTQDLLNLPVYNLAVSTFSGIGVGRTITPGPYHFPEDSRAFKPHFFFTDVWKLKPNLTVNVGLGYQFQTGEFDSDMPKPAFLQPLAGPLGGLSPTTTAYNMFSPGFGFAWSPGKSQKWVIRGGAGMYWDTISAWEKQIENGTIGPVGNGRINVSAGLFTNIFPGIVQQTSQGFVPLPVGASLPVQTITNMTLGQFMQIYNQQIGNVSALLSPAVPTKGPYSVTTLDYIKDASELFPHNFPMVRSYQTSLGMQRDLGHDMVLTVDWARRQFVHSQINAPATVEGIDLNHASEYVNGVASPVIPFCASSQLFVPGQECSTGAISIWAPYGRTIYEAMLLKLSKRFSNHFQFLVSYALQNQDSDSSVMNLNNFMQSYGPRLARNNLNVSGLVNLKYGLELSVNSSYISKTPFQPYVAGIDLSGTGATFNGPLAGTSFDCFNAGCGKSQLAAAVSQWNSTLAGTKAPNGATIPQLILPSDYQFGDPTLAQDFRLTKKFTVKEKYTFSAFLEAFNAFNIANLTGYSPYLDKVNANPAKQTFAFGQPTQRSPQSFLSGGPRALQVGARFQF